MKFSVLSYNIRHCRGADLRVDISRIASTIRSVNPDIVCLQEVYQSSGRNDKWHQAQRLSDELGMDVIFSPTVRKGRLTWGNAILSRYNMQLQEVYSLKSVLEPRNCQFITLDTPASKLSLYNTHLSYIKSERLKQMLLLGQRIQFSDPTILCGDFNANSSEISTLLTKPKIIFGDALTFPSKKPRKGLDNILISKHFACTASKALRSHASDHLPIIAELKLL